MPGEASPTARALRTIEILLSSPGITADAIAQRLGVSTRAVRRYMEILREAGIPVQAERGPAGGYRLGRGVRLPPLLFDTSEAIALVMAVLDGHHAVAGPQEPVGRALGKLMSALPAAIVGPAESLRAVTRSAPDRAAVRPDPAVAIALAEATAARTPVRLAYRSEAGRTFDIDADPWAVVVRHGRWYLLCRTRAAALVRTYRVDRVTAVETLTGQVEVPDDLDPVALLEEHLGIGWDHPTEVHIDAPPERVRRWLPVHLGRLGPLETDRTRLTGSTNNPQMYAEELAALPVPFSIAGDEALREAVAALAARLTRAAQPAGDPPPPPS